MSTRRQFMTGLLAAVVFAEPVHAKDFASEIEARLQRQGFRIESVGRTLLGRVRILAVSAEGKREIILNPRTGEILRDLWIIGGSGRSSDPSQGGDKGAGGGGEHGENDDGDDDDDDDDSDDDGDSSGHGGGSSGGGNSGSGGN